MTACILAGLWLVLPLDTRVKANGGRGQSYTASGTARVTFDPPSQFVGGFGQISQVQAAPAYQAGTTVMTPGWSQAVPAAYLPQNIQVSPTPTHHPMMRWVRRAR